MKENFTTRKRSCEKVMFSQVCVCSQGVDISSTRSLRGEWALTPLGVGMSRGWVLTPRIHGILCNIVNKRAVRIQLGCFLVVLAFAIGKCDETLKTYAACARTLPYSVMFFLLLSFAQYPLHELQTTLSLHWVIARINITPLKVSFSAQLKVFSCLNAN